MSSDQMSSIRGAVGRVNIWDGAIRTGKTIASLVAFLIFVAVAPTGGQLVVIARTRDSAYRNVFAPLMEFGLFGPISSLVSYTYGAPTARILGRVVYVIGASDAKAEKVLRGLTVAGAYVDEITVIPEEFFTQLLGRMSVTGARLFGTTNPDSPAHWFKVRFLDRIAELDGWHHFHFKLAGADHLDPLYVAQISSEFTGLWYRRFIEGEWVAAEGAVFDMWDPSLHVMPWDDLPEMRELIAVGIDYGTTNATAALLLGLSAERDPVYFKPTPRLFLIDEFRRDSRQSQQKLTDGELARDLVAWLGDGHLPPSTPVRLQPRFTIVDPSAASFRVELLKTHAIATTEADNDVLYGIRTMASLLANKRLIVSDRCPGFITEAPGYAWDPKATLKGEDKPIKVADHSLDAGRYAITTTENIWRQHLKLAA
jgi:PBSX family phage terminase large subunit